MMTVLRMLGIAAFGFLACFTGAKLIKMAQIRGFISGPVPVVKVITDKAVLSGRYGDAYWLAWDDVNIRNPSGSRINLPREVWEGNTRGNQVEVLYFPGDPSPYHRKDIFADNGNFAFDSVLLFIWLAGIVALTAFEIRRRSRRKLRRHRSNVYS